MALLAGVAAAVLLSGANYADYVTSRDALVRGGAEANPVYGSHGERLLPIKIGVVTAETVAFVLIEKHHKKTAWVYVASVVAFNLAVARHNAGVNR